MRSLEYSFYDLSVMAGLVSFLGFCVENIWMSVVNGYIDNRNMNFPFILGYGLTVLCIYFVLGTPSDMRFGHRKLKNHTKYPRLRYFMIIMIGVSIGETILGTFLEKAFGFVYWSYSAVPLHITKYTTVPTSLGFALIITVFMERFFNRLMHIISSMPAKAVRILGILLAVIMIADFLISFAHIIATHGPNIKWVHNMHPSEAPTELVPETN